MIKLSSLIRYTSFCLSLFFSAIFSISIDLSVEESALTFPLHEPGESIDLALHGFRKNTTYVLDIAGDIHLSSSDCSAVTIGKNNSVLIENEEQLNETDVLVLTTTRQTATDATLDTTLHIHKVVIKTDEYPNLGNEKWGAFIDKIRDSSTPGEASQRLAELAQDVKVNSVHTLGCESGRDPLYWVGYGADVTILDGTPHAIAITALRLAEKHELSHLAKALPCRLESIPDELGTFDAVTGTAVFSFIPHDQFVHVMSTKILSHVAPSGYFAGHFFGPEHEWAYKENMSFSTVKELVDLFEKNGFEILWINEIKTTRPTVFLGTVRWNEIHLIAQKTQ